MRVSFPLAIAPFTTVDAAILTDMSHNVHVVPSPRNPSGHAPQVCPTPGGNVLARHPRVTWVTRAPVDVHAPGVPVPPGSYPVGGHGPQTIPAGPS